MKNRLRQNLPKPLKQFFRRIKYSLMTPLELSPNVPDLFLVYRALAHTPDLKRIPGGWLYEGEIYPDYLTVGGACNAIAREAQKYCKGKGLDVGAGLWPLPNAIPVDIWRGPGAKASVDDFENESLDYIFSSHCLEHISNWKEALTLWGQKLRTGGVIFVYLPHPGCKIWHQGSPFVGDNHVWRPEPKILKNTLSQLGFDIIAADDGPDHYNSFYVCGAKQ